MRTAEEILNEFIGAYKPQLVSQPYLEKSITKAMKAYAKEALEEAAKKAESRAWRDDFDGTIEHEVEKDSILNIIKDLK